MNVKRESLSLRLLLLLFVISELVFVIALQGQESKPFCILGCDTVFLTQSCDWTCSPPGQDCAIITSVCRETFDSGDIYARQCKACGGLQYRQFYRARKYECGGIAGDDCKCIGKWRMTKGGVDCLE